MMHNPQHDEVAEINDFSMQQVLISIFELRLWTKPKTSSGRADVSWRSIPPPATRLKKPQKHHVFLESHDPGCPVVSRRCHVVVPCVEMHRRTTTMTALSPCLQNQVGI